MTSKHWTNISNSSELRRFRDCLEGHTLYPAVEPRDNYKQSVNRLRRKLIKTSLPSHRSTYHSRPQAVASQPPTVPSIPCQTPIRLISPLWAPHLSPLTRSMILPGHGHTTTCSELCPTGPLPATYARNGPSIT